MQTQRRLFSGCIFHCKGASGRSWFVSSPAGGLGSEGDAGGPVAGGLSGSWRGGGGGRRGCDFPGAWCGPGLGVWARLRDGHACLPPSTLHAHCHLRSSGGKSTSPPGPFLPRRLASAGGGKGFRPRPPHHYHDKSLIFPRATPDPVKKQVSLYQP